jgi:hypothetical protein
MLRIKAGEVLEQPAEEARRALLEGKIDAMLFVGGKPVPLFDALTTSQDPQIVAGREQLHFLPLDDPRMLAEYTAAEITPTDYGFMAKPVPTIAVTAVLMSYDFSSKQTAYGRARCAGIANIVRSLRENITWLRKYGHTKWNEVTLREHVGLWKRDACAKFRQVVVDLRDAAEHGEAASTAGRQVSAGRAPAR